MPDTDSEPDLPAILRATRVIAVLGAHADESRPAYYVPAYLHAQGYRVLPVNPALAGQTLFGERVRASLAELAEPADMVDVFRRSESLAGHLAEILALAPRPRVVWLQLGIRDATFSAALAAGGMIVVENRCLMVEHRNWAAHSA